MFEVVLTHVLSVTGKKTCQVAHLGLVLAGRLTAAMDDGSIVEMKAGDAFYIDPRYDSWVVGGDHPGTNDF